MRFSELTCLEEGVFRVRDGYRSVVDSQYIGTYVVEMSMTETERLEEDAEVQ